MAFERLTLSVMAASLIGLAACQQPLPNQTTDQTRQGALIGAGIGAALGAASGDNSEERIRNAVIGAAAVGAVGGAIGASLDRQAAELQQQLGPQVGVVNTGSEIQVTLPENILFATGSAQLSATSQTSLGTVARSLNNYPNTTVNVIGHADNTASAALNQQLSEERARAVANVLAANGVSPARLRTLGRGEDDPIASNQTPEGRQQNRRVEIIITPNQ